MTPGLRGASLGWPHTGTRSLVVCAHTHSRRRIRREHLRSCTGRVKASPTNIPSDRDELILHLEIGVAEIILRKKRKRTT